jgi:hypothetical protein
LTPSSKETSQLGTAFSFSRLFGVAVIFYAELRTNLLAPSMSKPTKQKNIAVIWEPTPDPDPHALLKAVAMMFNRRVPLSTAADLTKNDEELMCRRHP